MNERGGDANGRGAVAEKTSEPPPSKVEALDGSNYEEWSGRMRSAFKRYKLLKIAVKGANGELVGLGNVLLVEGLSANLLSVRRLQKSKAEVTFGPTSCRAKLGKKKLVKDGSLKGLEVKGGVKEIGSCPICLETKFSKFPFNSTTGPAKTPLALVHMDVVGPTRAPSLSGSRYFLTIVDDHTRAVWVYPLKSKGEVAAAVLKEWMPRAQRECGHKVALVKNRVLATVGDKEWIPYAKWYGSAPAVNMLRAFGCMVVFHVPKEKRGKLEASGRWGTTLRVLLAIAALLGWKIRQMDIVTAFLNGIIMEEVYMKQPEGLDDGSGREKDEILMLLVYVDDILLFSASTALLDSAEQMLEMQFKCSKMGEVKYYLGMHVERDVEKGVLRLHQRKYCEGLAEKYGLQDGGKPATPLPSGCTKEPTVIFCDNESAVKLAKNACLHGLTKHIRPKWHWVRRLLDKEVRLEIVKTHQQAADIFTKRLAEADHWKGMKLAGMSVH
ncbi:hypothetical protein CLOP_g6240 [Closterium sp. NIES-67]|nr:hypothetical protein CLOP_g6240 [Closterium sp. NIES-67]